MFEATVFSHSRGKMLQCFWLRGGVVQEMVANGTFINRTFIRYTQTQESSSTVFVLAANNKRCVCTLDLCQKETFQQWMNIWRLLVIYNLIIICYLLLLWMPFVLTRMFHWDSLSFGHMYLGVLFFSSSVTNLLFLSGQGFRLKLCRTFFAYEILRL